MSEQPYLDIKTAAGRRQLVLRDDEPLTIGRHSSNKLPLLDDVKASRFHCVVERGRGGQYVIRDLGASNGTFVNGQRIRSATLMPGDVVTVGLTHLVLIIPGAPPPPSRPREPYQGLLAEGMEVQEHRGGRDGATELREDVVEELSEDDLVYDEPIPLDLELATPPPPPPEPYDAPPAVVQGSLDDYEDKLWSMAEMVPHKPFGETDIALLNSRGQIVYPAGRPLDKGPRQPADLLRLLLLVCLRGRASDIHLEPRETSAHSRIRVDGVMVDAADFPAVVGQRLTGVVKVLGEIDMAQRNIVQEGNFSARVPAESDPKIWSASNAANTRRIDYRVSFAPSVNGQKLVIRVLDPSTVPSKLQDLKLPELVQGALASAIDQDSGMVLVSGPTGSGKTSTLYALVRSIDTRERNVVTIEDPVEIRLEDATQIPVDEEKGNSFPNLLRSVLRQDPDVILVGEIRDAETARVAMQASITGHLVFSTVHTKDTLGTVYRLLDLGVEPYLLSQGLQVVVAQRLVRQLCPFCRAPEEITPAQREKMGALGQDLDVTYQPAGCARCLGTGYAGRRAFFELLSLNDAMRDTITRRPTLAELQQHLAGTSFIRLADAGYQLVADGSVAFDEVEKAVGR